MNWRIWYDSNFNKYRLIIDGVYVCDVPRFIGKLFSGD